MYEKEFAQRLAQLRTQKGVSARDMSLSLGQNPGYINTIENGKAFPTMVNFFFICDYLHISPKDFFDFQAQDPEKSHHLTEHMKRLSAEQINALTVIINGLLHDK